LSGAVCGPIDGDLAVPALVRNLCVEVKARADGFRDHAVLIIKADRQEALRPALAAQIAKAG
jgi:hypothetical protein